MIHSIARKRTSASNVKLILTNPLHWSRKTMPDQGKIVTFYSYKGGVGRSMAIANVAVLLSKWKFRVLLADWDLEAPGLENFFIPYMGSSFASKSRGILDLL